MHAGYLSKRPPELRLSEEAPAKPRRPPAPSPRSYKKELIENLAERFHHPTTASPLVHTHLYTGGVKQGSREGSEKHYPIRSRPRTRGSDPVIYRSLASAEPPDRPRGREDAGNAGTKQRPGAPVVGTKHPGARAPPLRPGGQMAFLPLPDRPNPHPALFPELPVPPVDAAGPPGPVSHHPLCLSVTIVSLPRLFAPALPLPGAGAPAGGCFCRRFPPVFLVSSSFSPPMPMPMPPTPCTNFSVSHSFAGMVTGLASLRNRVDSARETATLPESIPRFDNLGATGHRRRK